MRLIDRYLLRELLTPLAYCLSGFLIIFVAFDLIFRIAQFQEAHLRVSDVVNYYLATMPEVLADPVIPVSFLFALLYALTNHSRHHELVAIRAAGVGVWRLAAPYLAVSVVLGLVTLALNEILAPSGEERAREIMDGGKAGAKDRVWTDRIHFRSDDGARDWVVEGGMNRTTGELRLPQVHWTVHQPGRPDRIYATNADFSGGEWTFHGAEVWENNHSKILPEYKIALPETPASLRLEVRLEAFSRDPAAAAKRPQLSLAELATYFRLHPVLNREQHAVFLTQWYGRIAVPFTCLAVALIAFPFGARGGRRNVFVGVASSVFFCFAYFFLQRTCMALGTGGFLPPAAAAGLPNLLFCGLGVGLMTKL